MELESPGAAYNVASGRGVRVGEILDWIVDEAGVDVEIEVSPDRVRPGESPKLVGDPSRLREDTDWQPERDVEESIRETYRWTRSRFDRTEDQNTVA